MIVSMLILLPVALAETVGGVQMEVRAVLVVLAEREETAGPLP
jgi:hypothetical protein